MVENIRLFHRVVGQVTGSVNSSLYLNNFIKFAIQKILNAVYTDYGDSVIVPLRLTSDSTNHSSIGIFQEITASLPYRSFSGFLISSRTI